MQTYAWQETEELQKRLDAQIVMNDKLLLELREVSEELGKLKSELTNIYDKPNINHP